MVMSLSNHIKYICVICPWLLDVSALKREEKKIIYYRNFMDEWMTMIII